jgi:hypothetical protein
MPYLLLSLVVLLSFLPLAQAPNWSERTWDIVWDGYNTYPDDDDPAWTQATTGTVSRSFQYNNQILNLSLTGAGADNERYTIAFGATEYAYAEARVNMPISGSALILRFDDATDTFYTFLTVLPTYIELTYINIQTQSSNTIKHYEEDIIGANHTYGLLYYTDGIESYYAVYYDHNLAIWLPSQVHMMQIDQFYFSTQDSPPSASARYAEWDYVALDLTNSNAKLQSLEDDIDELKRELEKLKKDTGPSVTTNQTDLPTIPHTSRGDIDDDIQFVDPYRTVVYTVNAAPASGSSIALYLPYPSSAEETTCIRDDLWIGGSYTRIWINDTVGSTELLNTTDAYAYFNLQYCYNATVETSGGDIIINRIVDVRLIDSFDWGWNRDSGLFSHRSTIENELAYNMENVRIYWAFPYEDEDGVSINVEGSSIEVWDDDNNLQLDQGRHYEATEIGGIALEVRWVNTSGTTEIRTYLIQFTRASHVETESYYTVYDTEISVSDTYEDAPYTVNVHHTSPGTANFEGKIIVRFQLSGQYAGKKLDVNNLYIKRSDSSLFQEFTYDSISNELRITDQSISAGESVTYTLYWDWYDEQSALQTLILGDPLVLYSLLLLAGFAGLFIFLDATKEEKRRKYAGILIIAIDVIILIIILIA